MTIKTELGTMPPILHSCQHFCQHCGSNVPPSSSGGPDFCCAGCQAAYSLIQGMGLQQYYQRRCIDPDLRPLRPQHQGEDVQDASVTAHVQAAEDGIFTLHLMIEGLHCAACVWLIEALLHRGEGVVSARVNMTTRRLTFKWRGGAERADSLLAPVAAIGYRLVPFDPDRLDSETHRHEKGLLRAMAVAGFAAGNVMLFSVSVWAGDDMGPATRSLMHLLSALVAVPAILYAIQPFLRSAISALRALRTNMDVPITLGVLLTTGVSLSETLHGGAHAYFDSAISLLFFLLVGRYLDSRARGRARAGAEHLLALGAGTITILEADGSCRLLRQGQVQTGQTILVAAGERIGADGAVSEGTSDVDSSLITGETTPVTVRPGDRVFAGTVNLAAPLRIVVGAVGEGTLLAEIVRMMEVAEQGRARTVMLADRVARLYSPVVHLVALGTFLGWISLGGASWQEALLTAVSVLIITCPCALALAVPVVQVVASGRLLRQGVLLKSATALERLASVTTIVFDKTGTLTLGRPTLLRDDSWTEEDLDLAASLAASSRHPLARALTTLAPHAPSLSGVREIPGSGLAVAVAGAEARLGSRAWCGVAENSSHETGLELWLAWPGRAPVRFLFGDELRSDAADVLFELQQLGLSVELLSGDRSVTVAAVAAGLSIDQWRAECAPGDKVRRLNELKDNGQIVLMVGDGLNDAPALAAADVSLSPATAVDISQTAADAVFLGGRLAPVVEILKVARQADRLVRQNFVLALVYNGVTVPLAIMGHVTPLFAAVAMSSSSIAVILNALRLARRRTP